MPKRLDPAIRVKLDLDVWPAVIACMLCLVAACAEEKQQQHCFPDGHCIVIPGNAAYSARRLLAVLSGSPSPAERAQQEIAAYEEKLKAAARAKAEEATPRYQLKVTRVASERLKANLKSKVRPLRLKYRREYDGYVAQLRSGLRAAGLRTHEDLLRARGTHLEVANTLHRAAVLEHAIAWLDQKNAESEQTLLVLDQSAWRLEKLVEMNEVASAEETGTILKIVANADAILNDRLSPPEQQDVAALEAELFTRLTSGGGAASAPGAQHRSQASPSLLRPDRAGAGAERNSELKDVPDEQ